MRLAGKVAVITGAASGFGEGMARRFAEEGARIVVADLNAKGAERVAGEIGKAAIAVTTDVSSRSEVDEMVHAAKSAFGRIDIMVNNAGYTHRNGDLTQVDEPTFDLITAINMKAIYFSTLAVVPIMERQGGGVILSTASTAGLRPRPGLTWYNASKGWTITATKSMAVELAPKNIRVNCLCPVAGETACWRSSWARIRRKGAPSFAPRFRSAGYRRRSTSPMRRSGWSRTRPNSSPAWRWKWMAAAASDQRADPAKVI